VFGPHLVGHLVPLQAGALGVAAAIEAGRDFRRDERRQRGLPAQIARDPHVRAQGCPILVGGERILRMRCGARVR
jgi:hypothetical protein